MAGIGKREALYSSIILTALLFTLINLISLKIEAQAIQPEPDGTPPFSYDQPIPWQVIHTFQPQRAEGAKTRFRGLVRETDNEAFQGDLNSLSDNLGNYLETNADRLKQNDIQILRIVVESRASLSDGQRKAIEESASDFGLKVRFETISIDYDARRRELQRQAEAEIHRTGISPQQKSGLIQKVREAARAFVARNYEKPTRAEWIAGGTKGGIAYFLTLSSWLSNGTSINRPFFWILSGAHFIQETVFGPYLKSYVNFLINDVKAVGSKIAEKVIRPFIKNPNSHFLASAKQVAAELSLPAYGNLQGFLLMGFDRLFLWLNDPNQVKPPNLEFVKSYFGMAAIGSALGGFMPSGMDSLVKKGWLNSSTSTVIMQMADLVFPIEGALLALDSPLLAPIFAAHQGVKFSIYLASLAAPTRGMITILPKALEMVPEILKRFNLHQILDARLFKDPIAMKEVLEDPSVPIKEKIRLTRFVTEAILKDREVVEADPVYKRSIQNIVEGIKAYSESDGPRPKQLDQAIRTALVSIPADFINAEPTVIFSRSKEECGKWVSRVNRPQSISR